MGIARYMVCCLALVYILQIAAVQKVYATLVKKETIGIGVLANNGKEKCFQQWRPTAAYLEQKLPQYHIQIVCLDFDEMDRAVSDRRVDFTISNPAIYVNLEYKYGASRISTLKNKSAGASQTEFGGVIVSRADRKDIAKTEDLRGKRFMAVAENAFGGWLVTWNYLQERGIYPSRDFAQVLFGGRHESVVMAVVNGDVDAGCVRTGVLERMASEGLLDASLLAVLDNHKEDLPYPFLVTTRLYPEWPLATMQSTAEDIAKKVALAMLEMPENSPAADSSQTRGWTIPMDYNTVHECLSALKIPPYSNLGTITPGQLLAQYKKWIFGSLVLFVSVLCGAALVLRLNRRLKSALADLELEHRQRAQVVADLNEFKLTLDQTLDCVYMFSGDTLQFIYANQGALDHIGYGRQELFSMTPLDIKPNTSEEQYRSMIFPLQKKAGHSIRYDSTNRRKDGTIVPVEVFLQYVNPPQKPGRFVAIVRDTSLRLEQEKEREFLRTRLFQEQKLASVGQLAAGIAHEINTPAQYLGTNIDFLREAFNDIAALFDQYAHLLGAAKAQNIPQLLIESSEKKQQEVDWPYLKEEIPLAIEQSIAGVKQVSSIVLAMKNFAHPGSSEKEPTDLNALLNTTLTVSRNEWKYVVDPVLELDPLLPLVPCMRNEIAQVFLNLIVNAAHSIAEKLGENTEGVKGTICISTKQVGHFAEITVADSGCGISEENLGRIYDPFFTTKEVGKGTGQGLTIAHDIVTNKHGGTLVVHSEEGVGTTFTLQLLINPALQQQKEEKQNG